MFNSSVTPSDSTGLWRRAWAASLVFHLTATIVIGVLVQRLPRGADLGVSSGMVIDLAAGDGEFDVGDDSPNIQNSANDSASPTAVAHQIDVLSPESAGLRVTADLSQLAPTPAGVSGSEFQPSIDQFVGSGRSGAGAQPSDPAGSRRSGPSRGRPAGGFGGGSRSTAEVFGVKGTGSKFVYLFDRSTSMEGPRLAAAKRQLINSLQALNSVNQFQIIFFNSTPHPIDVTGAGRMAFADDRNKRLAANMVGHVTADLGTDRYSALKSAIAFNPDVIFFLTDADDEMLPGEVSEILRANQRTGAAICVIEFGQDAAPPVENFLIRLARESGGQYGYVDASALAQ
ncbi:MAG: hypothetical protein WD669_03650 [Pirellulales bacterium]